MYIIFMLGQPLIPLTFTSFVVFSSALVLLFAGLASVQAQNNTGSASSEASSTLVSATSTNSAARNTASGSLQLGDLLNSLGGGLNLGNINFGNRNDVLGAIGLLMNQLCLGNFFNGNQLAGLGANQQLQLLFQLDQLNQLNRLGLLNGIDLQGIFNSGFGGSLGIFRGGNAFNRGGILNLAGFKRAIDEAMTKLETSVQRRSANVKRQQLCNIASIVTATADSGRSASETEAATASSTQSAA